MNKMLTLDFFSLAPYHLVTNVFTINNTDGGFVVHFELTELPNYYTLEKFERMFPELDSLSLQFFLQIMRSSGDILDYLERGLDQFEIPRAQFSLLMILFRNPKDKYTASELSKKTSISRASLTNILDSLEIRQLIKRIPHKEDRRKIDIVITEEGISFIHQILPTLYSEITEIFSVVDKNDKSKMINYMVKIKKNLVRNQNE
ncbi:hypothetical protein COF42_25615 [Bacillus wiedmannii]|uniref:MarR family winged helix-turn-helix transcriptional regulator n=1 Tax=Bacillus wiedmannii TaxID=1890302 RepID=UPI000BFDA8A4|nr:MarR family transcriptional regulator [Bacillus wiedmannii]PHC82972.1 hypothetical protein COF42_25615 [Bacillus wiedmannii]